MSPIHVADLICVVVEIRAMHRDDWPAVEEIYAEGIATRLAAFETATPTFAEFDAPITSPSTALSQSTKAASSAGRLSATSRRDCYAGVVEHSVYVRSDARGASIGRMLVEGTHSERGRGGLLDDPDEHLPGERGESCASTTSSGFRVVGRRERIAQLDGVWRDTILLERRA